MGHPVNKKKKKRKPEKRAGVIILKKTLTGLRVLCLRIYGSYDLPKGGVDPGEDAFTAALREAEEESGISDLSFDWGLVTTQAKNVTLFLASSRQEPVILPNPKTGEYEHHSAHWKTLDQASECLHPYLRPCMDWVKEVVGEA